MNDYEIHITLEVPSGQDAISSILKLNQIGCDHHWSTSKIDGDPVLGPGVKYYFTRHERSLVAAETSLNYLCSILETNGFKPIRKKIEHVVYDHRTHS